MGPGVALKTALDACFDGMAALEAGRIVGANEALGSFLGCHPRELLGRALSDIVRLEESPLDPVETSAAAPTLEGALRLAPRTPFEATATLWGGKEVPVEVLWRPWAFGGRPLDLVAVRSVSLATSAQSALRRYQAELERKNGDLARANRVQREFLGTLSHELRTPLTSVIGYAQVLGDELVGPLNDRQRDYAETIYTSGLQLMALIDGLLDLSRLEAGTVTLQRQAVPLAALLREGAGRVQADADAKGISVELRGVPEAALDGDPARLAQVVGALLSNAVKFTPLGGEVLVSARVHEDEVVIEVQDNGIGIAEADQAHVFTPFFLVDASSGRQQSGAGLGLALAKRLVALHGGRIGLSSQLGRGSCFSVALPRFNRSHTGAATHVLPPN